jgi:hypothetical protein
MELGCAEVAQGRVPEAASRIEQALAIFREAGPPKPGTCAPGSAI